MKPSITTRLALAYAAIALATFALLGVLLYLVLAREMLRHQAGELEARLANTEFSLQHIGTPERWQHLRERFDALNPQGGDARIWVLSDDPRFRYGNDLAEIARGDPAAGGLGEVRVPGRATPLRTLSRTVPALGERPAVRVIVGLDPQPFERTLHRFGDALAALAVVAVAIAGALGWGLARVGLRPLRSLSREAGALSPRQLSQRLAEAGLPVELQDMAAAFNGALDRLEGAYVQLEAFNADVAHELRTPLTNLIGSTQVALARPRGAGELEEVMQSNLEELERVRAIVNDMLFLARADQGEAASGLVHTRLADELAKTIEFFEFVLEESGCRVVVEGDLQAQAPIEIALFRRAVSNLIQNAIQHSARGSRIVARVSAEGDELRVALSNPGPPVAAEHLPRLFDRFYRVDAARNGSAAHRGHGLGLAIVRAVARMHGGATFARSEAGATTIGFGVRANPREAGT